MAGSYPDPFGPRLAYDRDGTVLLTVKDNGTITQITQGTGAASILSEWNNDDADYGAYKYGYGSYGFEIPGDTWICLVFPTPRDLTGYRFGWVSRTFNGAQWSTNTTNGYDGTWTAFTNPASGYATDKPGLRSNITAISGVTGAKAIRFKGDGAVYYTQIGVMHLYGKPSTDGDRLLFWHPTLNQPLRDTPSFLDWGNRARDTTDIKTVRVKNVSTSLTATNVAVSMEMLAPDANPSLVNQHTFSYNDGASFDPSIVIPSLAPGEVSNPIQIKQALSISAQMGLWSSRFLAVAGGWGT